MPSPVSKELRGYLDSPILTEEEIEDTLASLVQRIEDYYLPGDFGLVPVLPYASVFATDLLRKIRIPVRLFPSVVTATYKGISAGDKADYDVSGTVHMARELPNRVLIVSTVADASLDWLTYVGDICRRVPQVKNVRTCALFQTSDCSSESKPIDFLGVSLPTATRPFAGYGITYKGYYPQLTSIHTLRTEF